MKIDDKIEEINKDKNKSEEIKKDENKIDKTEEIKKDENKIDEIEIEKDDEKIKNKIDEKDFKKEENSQELIEYSLKKLKISDLIDHWPKPAVNKKITSSTWSILKNVSPKQCYGFGIIYF
jgi:hypothetical protein